MEDRYKIYERLGEGGVGAVFRAYDTQLKRWVAIKRLFAEAGESADADELRREADSLAALSNPNIVTIFDVASDEEGLFIVMELLEGEDLSGVLEQGPMSFDDFKELANQTLEGLMAAHQLHILHRDIKPENIKIERLPGGRLQSKIIDFGLARAGLKARKQTESLDGTVMGSIFYMAPEQLSRQPVDERGDLYSLGCVYYEALSGKKAFNGATMAEVVDKHLRHEFAPLHTVAIHVPAGLVAWVTRLMELRPEDRFASAQEAIESFRAWEKSPAAMPFGAWTTPMVPTSESISAGAPVGGATQALAALTASHRPVAAVRSRLPAGGSAKQKTKAVPPASAVRSSPMSRPKTAAASEGGGTKIIAIIGGCVLAVGLLAWMFSGGDDDKPGQAKAPPKKTVSAPGKAPASKPAAASSTVSGSADPAPPLLAADVCVHFLAETGVLGAGDRPAAVGGRVLKWDDVAGRGGNNTLAALELHPEHAPLLVEWPGPNLKPGTRALSYKVTQGEKPKALLHEATAVQSQSFPKSREPVIGAPGATMAVVFQCNNGTPAQRVMSLSGPDGHTMIIRADGKGNVVAIARSAAVKSDPIVGKNVNARFPTVAVASWSAGGELTLRLSNPSGKIFQGSKQVGPLSPPLNKIELGRCFKPDGAVLPVTEQFRGHLAEAIIYASALDKDQIRDLEVSLRERYFVKP